MTVVIRPAAAADIEDAYVWYRERRTELGYEFLDVVRGAIMRIIENPQGYPILHRNTHRIRLQRFPYALFYRVQEQTVVVVACMHGRRDPRRWKFRR